MTIAAVEKVQGKLIDATVEPDESELASPYARELSQTERWEMITHTENESIRQKVLAEYFRHAKLLGEFQRVYKLAPKGSVLEQRAYWLINWMR